MIDKQLTQEELLAKRTELLEELKKTGFKIEDAPEFKGLLKDLNTERQTRQQVQSQVSTLQEQLDILISEKDKDEDDDSKDEEYLTKKEAKKMLGKVVKESEKEEEQRKATELANKFASDEVEAIPELTEEKQGKGLDYMTVLQEGYAKLIAENPAYKAVVLDAGRRGKNMAKEAYRIGLTHPDIASRIQARKNAELLEEINKPGKTSKSASIETVMDLKQSSFEELMKKTPEELETMIKANEEKARQ